MNLKNDVKNELLLFIVVLSIGVFVSIAFSFMVLKPYWGTIFNGAQLDMLSLPREKTISLQVISMIGFFIIPPVLFSLFSKNEFMETFNLHRIFSVKKYLYAFLLALVLFPVLINIQYLVMQIPFPESWKAIAEAQRAANESIIAMFLDYPGIPNLVFMIFMIGVGAGLTEELFFRGLLLPLFKKWFNSKWAAIILSSAIFSLFHLNAYDFLPILLVGILFGYLYTKTWDLKLNIFIHAVYNSFQVVLNYFKNQNLIDLDINNVDYVPIWLWVLCFIAAGIFLKLILKENEHIST